MARFRLRTAFFVMTIAAVLSLTIHRTGLVAPIVIVSSVFGLVLTGIFVAIHNRNMSLAAMAVFVLAFAQLFVFLGRSSFFFPLYLGITLAIASYWLPNKRDDRVKRLTAITWCWMGVTLYCLWMGSFVEAQYVRYRQENGFKSLGSRLIYESKRLQERATQTPIELSDTVDKELDFVEKEFQIRSNLRSSALKRLHEASTLQFANEAGFGVARMMLPNPDYFETKPSKSITPVSQITRNRFQIVEGKTDYESILWNTYVFGISKGPYPSLHNESTVDFLNPLGFGIRNSSDEVAGFVPHSFHLRTLAPDIDERRHVVRKIELVSLLKFDAPRVYVSEFLPRMDQMSAADFPTRELDDFEQEALKKLWLEDDLIIHQPDEEGGESIRMLGSLRASTNCLDCHQVPRGFLLGAFSYTLDR